MAKNMKYKSEMLAVLHEDAVAMYEVGGITEARMQEYDELCLRKSAAPVPHPVAQNVAVSCKRTANNPVLSSKQCRD
jgi:DNA-binding transcriptional regulator YiaG